MKTKKWPLFLWTILAILCFVSCVDRNEWDDPAGGQKIPDTTVSLLKTISFSDSLEELDADVYTYEQGVAPEIIADNEKGNVLSPNGGYVRFANPLQDVQADAGGSVVMWVKVSSGGKERALFSFMDESAATSLSFFGNGDINFKGADSNLNIKGTESDLANVLTTEEWHLLGIAFGYTGYSVYVDGTRIVNVSVEKDADGETEYSPVVRTLLEVPYFYLGHGTPESKGEIHIGEVNIYKNLITERHATPEDEYVKVPDPVYLNTFNNGLSDARIIGGGSLVEVNDKGFGQVFQNVAGGRRQNYLLLPSNIFQSIGQTRELTIGMWVNAKNAGNSDAYAWAPLFTAHSSEPFTGDNGLENGYPMFALEYRGSVHVNNDGWSDMTSEYSLLGETVFYHNDMDWLADDQWHYYTATLTEDMVYVYFDGEIVNAWQLDGNPDGGKISGMFDNIGDYSYFSVSGNQSWGWTDDDAGFMIDDIAIYNTVLTQAQIRAIVKEKTEEFPEPVYLNNFEGGLGTAQIKGGGSLVEVDDKGFGQVFRNMAGGPRENYLLLPSDVLSNSSETLELTVGVWVNASTAGSSSDYLFAPLFMAYGAEPASNSNTFPMLAFQYRGLLQVNCAGWCDFTNDQNVAGFNTEYNGDLDPLADGKWHYYTATFTETTAKFYVDGELMNEWTVSGEGDGNVIKGLFTNGYELNYICLGGNQAWDWGDNDAGFMFDDIAIYNVELTQAQIKTIIAKK